MLRAITRDYFRNKWWKIYISDVLLIIILTSFLIYARYKISIYLALINSYASDFEIIRSKIANQTAGGVLELQNLLSGVSPIVDRLNIFTFFIVPVVVFLVWVFFNSVDFNIIRKGRFIHVLPSIAIITIPFFLLFIYLLNIALLLIKESLFSDWKLYLILVIILILSYLLESAYSFFSVKDIKSSIVLWLKSSLFKVHSAIPWFLLHALSFALLFGSMFNIAIKYVTNNIGSAFWSFVVALLSILLVGLTRNWFYASSKK